jgi:hypothetical protein
MEFSDKTTNLVHTATAVGVGVIAWENAATAKWAANNPVQPYSLFSMYRFKDAVCGLVGKNIAAKIFNDPSMSGRGADFKPTPFGAINQTSIAGIGVSIANKILTEAWPAYRKLPLIPELIGGAGLGLAVGGIIGGIFDPNPSGFTAMSNNPVTGQVETGGVATGNVPYSRAGTLYQGSVLQ